MPRQETPNSVGVGNQSNASNRSYRNNNRSGFDVNGTAAAGTCFVTRSHAMSTDQIVKEGPSRGSYRHGAPVKVEL